MTSKKKKLWLSFTDTQINSISGATSGIFVSILMSPLDVMKARIQVKRIPKGLPSTPLLTVMYRFGRREGFFAFYKGLGVTMLGYVPNWTLYFTVYQSAKNVFASYLSSIKCENDMLVNLFASVTSGAISSTVLAPLWTIRVRMMTQSYHDDYRNTFHAARKIYKTEGIHAFYRGVIPSLFGLIHVGVQFPTYEYLKKKCASHNKHDKSLSIGQIIFSSSISKLIASAVAYPHEVVRSRLQDAGHARSLQIHFPNHEIEFREYKNVRDAVRTIAKYEGLPGFYRGLLPTLLRTVPAAVLTLLSYEKMKEFLTNNYANGS